MWVYYNPNPVTERAGDCAVRAIAKALGISWESAYLMITMNGFTMGDVMSSNIVWGSVLRQNGYRRYIIPNTCPDCYSIKDFCKEHPQGIYVLGTSNHVTTVIDGDYYDAWDAGNEIPLYYWTKENEENGI